MCIDIVWMKVNIMYCLCHSARDLIGRVSDMFVRPLPVQEGCQVCRYFRPVWPVLARAGETLHLPVKKSREEGGKVGGREGGREGRGGGRWASIFSCSRQLSFEINCDCFSLSP